jgi:hypothetical protein
MTATVTALSVSSVRELKGLTSAVVAHGSCRRNCRQGCRQGCRQSCRRR